MNSTGAGIVTALTPEIISRAGEFADHHARRFTPWPPSVSPEAFAEGIVGATSLTVFAAARQITSALLDSLAEFSVRNELPVGLIPCTPSSTFPIAPRADEAEQPLPARSLLYSYFFSRPGIRGVADVYGRPSSAEFLEEAAQGAAAIILHTHGNGADAPVSEAILCARVETGPMPAPTRGLPCQSGGPCIREHHDVRFYFGPSFLRCHALVFLSCTGFPPADSLLQYEASLVYAALQSGRIRSIVTSTRMTGGSDLSLALTVKGYLDDGHSMGELALAINHSDAEGRPHYVCIGDPEHRPVHGPMTPGALRAIPDSPPTDSRRAANAIIAIGEAELLARCDAPSWTSIAERVEAFDSFGETAAYVPLPPPPTLVGTRGLPLGRVAELVVGPGRCPRCQGRTERYRYRSNFARGNLLVESCADDGISSVDAQPADADDTDESPRAARWLFTALTLRRLAKLPVNDILGQRYSPMALAHTLEEAALSGSPPAASRELDSRIAAIVGAAVSAGSELFHSRQQRFLSVSTPGTADVPHHCGQNLMYVDFVSVPVRLTRRIWFCPLCGVSGSTLAEHRLPDVWVTDGHWHVDASRTAFAEQGCALTLAWERQGLHRDTWTTSTWIADTGGGPLGHAPLGDRADLGGLRFLNAVMVADGELVTVRVPLHRGALDGRLQSVKELNDRDGVDPRPPWRQA